MAELQIEQVPLGDLIPDENNARTHGEEQVRQLTRSIAEFGFINPVIVDDDLNVVAGHGRLMAAQQLGLERVPVIRASHLTPEQVKLYRIADNKLALNAGWDEHLLTVGLGELMDAGLDVELTGFSLDEIGDLLDPKTGADRSGSVIVGGDRFLLLVDCGNEATQAQMFDEMKERGYEVKVMS